LAAGRQASAADEPNLTADRSIRADRSDATRLPNSGSRSLRCATSKVRRWPRSPRRACRRPRDIVLPKPGCGSSAASRPSSGYLMILARGAPDWWRFGSAPWSPAERSWQDQAPRDAGALAFGDPINPTRW